MTRKRSALLRAWLWLALAVGLVMARGATAQTPAPGRPALIAAAANMQAAMTELVPLFEKEGKGKLSVNIGASANLVRQIQQGLPAELFLSADEDFALRLVEAGLTRDRGAVYATGRLVLATLKESPLKLDPQLASLKESLASGSNPGQKFAIAHPELAPYGKAAVQAMQKQGIWPLVQPRLVLGESLAQTTQYISTGAAPSGMTALALVLSPAMADRVRYVVVAADLHAPIRQRMVLLKTAGPTARAFYDFLQTTPARAVLQQYGYE